MYTDEYMENNTHKMSHPKNVVSRAHSVAVDGSKFGTHYVGSLVS